jgi:hypothetical protein
MSRYVYGGPAGQIGRHGYLSAGDIVDLTAAEAASVASDPNWFAEPTRTQQELKVTANATLTADDVGKKIVCVPTEAIKVTLPASPDIGDKFEIFHGEGSSGDDITIEPGEGNTIQGQDVDQKVASVTVDVAGTGYDGVPTVGFTGGNGSGATATARMKALTATPADGGTGYEVGDTIVIDGGTKTTALVLTVATIDVGGVILTATVTTAGNYSALPSNPASQASTSGVGEGATFTLTWGVLSITVSAGGEGYTEAPTVGFTGGNGSDAAATAVLGEIPGNLVLAVEDDSVGLYWNGDEWVPY